MTLKRVFILMSGTVAMVLAGCGDKQEANKSNFKAAIQDYYDKTHGLCVAIPGNKVPFMIEKEGALRPLKLPEHAAALTKAGLLSAVDAKMPHPWDKRPMPATKYSLTELGKKHFVKGAVASIVGTSEGFCSGKLKVVEVENFTQPADYFGSKVSQVNFAYEIADAADWAKVPEMQAAYPQLKAATERVRDKTVLVATGEGWMHERQFKSAGGD